LTGNEHANADGITAMDLFEPRAALDQLRNSMTPLVFSAQYQQSSQDRRSY
jgi:hypothetical protein